mgnify:CR=1 FL=1
MGGREASCGITMTKEGDLQECAFLWGSTLDSEINVAPWINVASGKFDKKNKRSPLKCANLCSKM